MLVFIRSGQKIQNLGTPVDVGLLRGTRVAGRRRDVRTTITTTTTTTTTTSTVTANRPIPQGGQDGGGQFGVRQMADYHMWRIPKVGNILKIKLTGIMKI